jgi:gliding motility-associated-like protein
VFATIAPLCQNSTAPALPLTSTNGVTGTWNPATINTSTTGTTTFTFTPAATACAETATMDITILPIITTTFESINSLCQNNIPPVLPSNSTNTPAIPGIWTPSTINTSLPGKTTYTFNPDQGQCATTTSRIITVDPPVIPTFTQIGPLLQNSLAPALPSKSTNGIAGTWSPSTINTTLAGTATYTFTPAQNECAKTTTMAIAIQIEAVISGQTLTGSCENSKLDATGSAGDIVKYEWAVLDPGGELTQKTGINTEFHLSPNFSGSLPADFRVLLTITDRLGNTSSDEISITVDPPPVADVFSSGKLEKDGSMIVDGTVSSGTVINYKWSTSEGKIIGPDNLPTAHFFGAGMYRLEITDVHGCQNIKDFKFPIEIYKIFINPDYARISWTQDTTINVLENDRSSVKFVPNSVWITKPPMLGGTKVNNNGTITYTPTIKGTGHDQFIYEVCDDVKLCGSATVDIDIYESKITIPEGLSPNGDGLNDILVFNGLQNYKNSQIYVYSRAGQLVYKSLDYQNEWGGTTISSKMTNSQLVPTGTYYYVLKLGNSNRSIKGYIYIGY